MAIQTLTPNENAVRTTLTECDELVQRATDKIETMTMAAKNMLALDAHSLVHVASLLDMISDIAADVQNEVNARAEKHGAHYIDDAGRAISSRLWGQHFAMRGQ